MNRPLISIIVPIYNVENYLEKCIYSLINQSYGNLEIILINDGSPDNCGEICSEFLLMDRRIKVINKENGGVSSARNTGLSIARGEWISFVDPDDYVEPNYIELLINTVLQDQTKFAYCSFFTESGCDRKAYNLPVESGVYSFKDIFSNIFFGKMSTSLVLGLFSRKIIEDNKIRFDTNIRKAEDWLFYSLYLPQCSHISIINLPLYHYYQNADSVMHKYYVPTDLGVEKGLYILNEFEKNMLYNNIDQVLYVEPLKLRYVKSVLRYAIGVWDKRNDMKYCQKHKMVKNYIKKYKIYATVLKYKFKEISFRDKCEAFIVKSRSVFLLNIYALVYLALKF